MLFSLREKSAIIGWFIMYINLKGHLMRVCFYTLGCKVNLNAVSYTHLTLPTIYSV